MSILRGQSQAIDARDAVREVRDAIGGTDRALVMLFCSPDYDLDIMAEEIERRFQGVPLIGCTAAGEIGPDGYLQRSVSGVSFPSGDFTAAIGRLDDLRDFDSQKGRELTQRLLRTMEQQASAATPQEMFAIQLIDGLSMREELVTHAMQTALGEIPLVGGSAGDDGRFVETLVYADGAFRSDSAAFALLATRVPFSPFKIQHFNPSEERMVVTAAEPSLRKVDEIDGLPAAEEYARRIDLPASQLSSSSFAEHPVVVLIDGTDFVRSVRQAEPDGGLTFYSAVEEGLVLRIARGADLVERTDNDLGALERQLGGLEAVLAFDCILRRQEALQSDLIDGVADVFKHFNAVGFGTYGEQIRGVHVNQTLTGVAIGAKHD